jgi:hypothetical protein
MKKHLLTPLFSLLLLSLSCASFAQGKSTSAFPKPRPIKSNQEYRIHAGVFGGVATPEERFRNTPEYGVDVGFQPYIPFGVGLEVSAFSTDRSIDGVRDQLNRTMVLAKASYNFGGDQILLRDSYVGLGLGPAFDSSSPWNGTHFVTAPMLGFDIPLARSEADFISLGLVAKYHFVSGPSPDGFALNGAAKYWF